MSETAFPDYQAARKGTLRGVIDQAIQNALTGLEVMLPATIVSYDRATNRAVVQPSIMMVTTANQLVSRAPLASVQVMALGGGGFVANFPLPAGSKGWIKAADRDISLYLQSGNAGAPNTKRMHSFSDGLFIPDVGSGFTIASEDASNAVIQNLAGTVKVSLGSDTIELKATTVTVTGDLRATGTITEGYGGSDQVGVSTHTHKDVSGGTGNSGPPNPGT
jgi:Phage protein Gp138 N-terminal domain